ncbi:MAG: hypothetical protein OYL97_03140 [Candidatus Poribacteria bacterium]|nr:hypothetical protein [Candidatus Poribacteria bacterium]
MKSKSANNRAGLITKLGIGCVVCLLLGFGILLYAQDKTKAEFIGTKPEMNDAEMTKMKEMNAAKMEAMAKAKEQAAPQRNRAWGRQNRGRAEVDFGENEAFYKTIIDNNLFRPLGWTPPNNEPAYSLIGTAVDANGRISQATLLEKRSNRYHFVRIGSKLGDMTVKDIQAEQVTLDKAGKPITLKEGPVQFLTTSRGREGSRGGERSEGDSEKADNNSQNRSNQMDAAKRREMEMKEQAANQQKWRQEMMEKMKEASADERREMMEQFRRRRGENRRGRGRDR